MKSKMFFINKTKIGGLLMLAGLFAALSGRAQSNDQWTGAGSGNLFSDPNDWAAVAVPASGDSLEFGGTGPNTTLINDLAGLGVTSLTYDSGALGFTINGNAFTNGTSTAGTIFNVNSANAQTINNNLVLGNAVQTINLNSGNLTLGGLLGGAGTASGLSINANTYTLSLNGANTYGSAGSTTINNGTVSVGSSSAFGLSRVNIYNGPSTIDLNGHNLSVAFINNSGALTGGTIDNVSAGGVVTLKVGSGQGGVNAASGTYTSIDSFSGVIKNTTGTVNLTKVAPAVANQTAGIMATASLMNGPAVLRLINANTYSGLTTINGGMIELNFNNANNGGSAILANILPATSTLVLGGGDLLMDGPAGVSPSQTLANTILNAGASHIASYRQSSTTYTLTLGGITRNPGATVDFQSRPSGTSSNQKIGAADGTDNTTNVEALFTGGQQTILGGYATYNSYTGGSGSWATTANNTANASKAIGSLATYNTGFAAGKDVDAAIGATAPASMFINSLRFNTAGAYTVSTGGNITNATGGILETLTVGANAVAINNNILTSGNGQDLIIHQYNTLGAMTIGANIVDSTGPIGLTKSGPGALTLTPNAANTFSGQLTLNAGTTTLGNANALNGVPAVVFGGMSQTFGGSAPAFTYANGTLNLNGNSVAVASLTASTDSSGTALVQNANATPATLTVNGTATTSFTGTLQDGTGGGSLSLVKNGSGSQTVGGTLSYSGSTTVGAGTLALTTPATSTASYAVNGTLNVTALTNSTLALVSPQILSGSGTVTGSVTVASSAHTRPGVTGVTNTITGNLAYSAGAKADFDLNTSATGGPNSQIVLSGTSSVLTCGGVAVNINLIGAALDTTHDYVLFRLSGGSASISGTFNSVPTWLGTVPANSGSYSIITDTVNKNVRLHYTLAAAPAVVGVASPATVVRNQSTFVSVTVTPGSGTVTNVYLDLTLINGANQVPLTLSATANVYTNTIIIPAAAPVGSTHIVANAKDTTPLTGTGNITLTILATNDVWNGASLSDANWSDNANWVAGLAPGLTGDTVTFDGTTQLAANLDNSYSLAGLTFDSTAGAFVVTTANSSVLTLAGGVTNSSANAQSLNVPVVLATTQPMNAATADLTLGGVVTGAGLTQVGAFTLHLSSGANTYTGNTVISNGTVEVNNGGSIGGSGQLILAGGTFMSGYATGTRYTVGNNINVPAGNIGTILLSDLNRLNGTATGGGILNINAPGGQDDLGGGWNTYSGQVNLLGGGTVRLFINGGGFNGFDAATVTLTNVSLSVSDNSGGNSFNVGAFNLDSTATITGPFAGNSPNFNIGLLNQNDVIAGSVQGNTRITKVGTGNLTISSASGAATYTGQTLVNGGTLTVSGVLSSSPVTNYTGTTLTGTGTFGGPVDLETNSTITPVTGNVPGVYGTLTCGSDLTFNGATNIIHINTNYCDLITVGGNLSLNGGAIQLDINGTLTNGTYLLMTYSGSEIGSAANLVLRGFSQPGQIAVLSDGTPGQINLIVATPGAANLTWASQGNQDNVWNVESSLNWSNGATITYFVPGDHVTFNDTGEGNSPVDVRSIVQPSTMVVTGALDYVFESTTGGGNISGATNSLTFSGTGTAEMYLQNSYGGPTTIGTGYTLTVGNGADAASLGAGVINNNGTLIFNQTNTLSLTNVSGNGSLAANGSGTVTLAGTYAYTGPTTIGSGATLQVGTGGATGPLASSVTDNGTLIMTQSGSLALNNPISGTGTFTQNGSSTITLNTPNTYQGNTFINHGVVKLGANNVLPDMYSVSGSTGWLILDGNTTNAGTLDLNGFNDAVNVLQGLSNTVLGDITNSSAANLTNTLTFGNDFNTSINGYSGLITENPAGGKIALIKQGISTNILSGANSFSGGTIVQGGTLTLANGAAAGSGTITLSNGATLGMAPNGSSFIFVGNTIYTGPGMAATNISSSAGNAFTGLFSSGDANSTNVIVSSVSVSAAAVKQFQSFLGTVSIAPASGLRFSASTLGTNGGDNTTFDIEGTLNTRNGTVAGPGVSLGALTGSGFLTGAANAAGASIYTIGAKGIDSTFAGTIEDGSFGIAGIVKTGVGELTLSGTVSYTGNTTVNDGTLALVEPVSLDSSPTITLGGSAAVIDVSGRADGTLNLGLAKVQTLTGVGAVTGSLLEAANSFVTVGLGTLTVSTAATFNGGLTVQLNRTNAITHGEVVSPSITVTGPLTVSNLGPALQGGDTFQLFNSAVTGFSATNLPVLGSGMIWTNKLAVNGSLAVVATVNTTPTNITSVVSGTTLTLSWPADHIGWRLVAQTNALNVGLNPATNAWFTVPGSASVNSIGLPLNPNNPTVFYRMVYP